MPIRLWSARAASSGEVVQLLVLVERCLDAFSIRWRRKRWVVIVSPKLRYAEDDPTDSRRAAHSRHSCRGGLYRAYPVNADTHYM